MSKTIQKIVKVYEKGQITIPKEIQILLQIKKGDQLILVVKNEMILIQKAIDLAKQMEDDFDDLINYSGFSLKKLWLNKENEVWCKYL